MAKDYMTNLLERLGNNAEAAGVTQDPYANVTPEQAYQVASFVPGPAEAIGAKETYDAAKQGNFLEAGITGAATLAGLFGGIGPTKRLAKEGTEQFLRAATKETPEAFKKLKLTESDVNKWQKANKVKQQQQQIPELAEAAKQLQQGRISSKQYRELAENYLPLKPITSMPKMPSKEEIAMALNEDKVKKGIVGVNKSFKNGERISSRLDIPAYEGYDTWVVSLHDGTKTGGKALGYGQTAVLKNVDFKSSSKGALNIASQKTNKSTIARIYGDWQNKDSKEVYKLATKLLEESKKPNSEWVQVGMNPYRASYFYDKATGLPVTGADEVIQVGPLVLAKNVKKASPDDAMFSITKDSSAPTFATGGLVLGGTAEQDDEMYSNPLLRDPFDYVTP